MTGSFRVVKSETGEGIGRASARGWQLGWALLLEEKPTGEQRVSHRTEDLQVEGRANAETHRQEHAQPSPTAGLRKQRWCRGRHER